MPSKSKTKYQERGKKTKKKVLNYKLFFNHFNPNQNNKATKMKGVTDFERI